MREFLLMNKMQAVPSKAPESFAAEESRELASAGFDKDTVMPAVIMAEWNWKYDGVECAIATD